MIAALVLTLIVSSSQGPVPTPGKAAHKQQQQATPKEGESQANQNGADNPQPAFTQPRAVITTQNQQQDTKPEGGSPTANWWGIGNTILLTLFNGALAFLAFRQWRAMRRQADLMRRQAVLMRGQLAEMQTTSADTHELAAAAKIAAQAAATQASNEFIRINALLASASAAKESADVAQDQLTAIVNVARARLSVKDISHLPVDFLPTENTIKVSVVNRGHTPAVRALLRGRSAIAQANQPVDWGLLDSPQSERLGAFESVSLIGAGLSATLPIELLPMPSEEIEAICNGEAWLHMQGIAEYFDVFRPGIRHTLVFTVVYHPEYERWIVGQETETDTEEK